MVRRVHILSKAAGLLLIVFGLQGCGSSDAPASGPSASADSGANQGPAIEMIDHPAAAGAGEAHLLMTRSGDLLASWVEKADDRAALKFARYRGRQWSPSSTIASGTDWFVNWADFPAMAEDGQGRLYAHWLQREGESTYAYGIRLTHSDDGGLTWSEPIRPHDDAAGTEHGFVSYFNDADGRLGLAWLDGRNTAGGHGHGGGMMTIRAAVAAPEGLQSAELDAGTCDCCQTDAALTDQGPVVVYRDRTEDEIRDIAIVRWQGEHWSDPVRVARDEWHIAACPVNGPAVAAAGDRVAVAWFTMANGVPSVRLAISEDGGGQFGEPIEVDDGAPLGRVDLAMLANGDLVVSWLEDRDDRAVLRLLHRSSAGERARLDVGATDPGRSSGFPRMAVADDAVYVTWREVGEADARLRMARVRLNSHDRDAS